MVGIDFILTVIVAGIAAIQKPRMATLKHIHVTGFPHPCGNDEDSYVNLIVIAAGIAAIQKPRMAYT